METEYKEPSNVVAIAKFFGISGVEAVSVIKSLTEDEKNQLGEGIRSGSLTY